jgi:hypothetical protein
MKFSPELEKWRVRVGPYASKDGEPWGAFTIEKPWSNYRFMVIASSGDKDLGIDWEHVSVSLPNRCPNWPEMCYIKSLFWDDEETVMQLHPPKSQWINNHNFCLHMWRPLKCEIPLPPAETVGNKELGTLK